MASKSGGTIPPPQSIADANQAVALLSMVHHWNCTKSNGTGRGTRYVMTVTHAGRRVTVSRRSFVDCVGAAFEKLRGGETPTMRLAR